MRIAIVHDWLVGMRGGEQCLEVLCGLFPQADLYTLFHRPDRVSPVFANHKVFVSNLGQLPIVERYYRHLLPGFALGVRSLSRMLARQHALTPYELVISISHCVAKNIEVPRGVPHLCYCLTPARYYWDQYDRYFAGKRFEPLIRRIVSRLRTWDVAASAGVTEYVAISEFVAERIRRLYGRDASVVYPPVRSDWITTSLVEGKLAPSTDGDGFLCVSALVPYKNVDLIVEAFNGLPYQLKIVGTGPEARRLQSRAKSNIEFIGFVDSTELARLYASSKALVFGAVEDFGMVPVEMMAAGRPVIAFSGGGVLETVRAEGVRPTGVLFSELSVGSIQAAVRDFISRQGDFTAGNCVLQAKVFSETRFISDFEAVLQRMRKEQAVPRSSALQRVA